MADIIYIYDALKYNCNKTVCGQYVGRAYISSVNVPLSTGAWYVSPNTPGFVYQAASINYNEPLSVSVEVRAFDGCSSACAAFNSPASPSATPTPSVTRTPSVTPSITSTPSITRTPSVTPSLSISASVSPTPTPTSTKTPTPTVTRTPSVTPTVTRTPSVTPSASPSVGFYVTMSYQINQSVSSLVTFPTSSIINTGANAAGANNTRNYDYGFKLYTAGQTGYNDFPDTLVTNNNIVVSSSLYLAYSNPVSPLYANFRYVENSLTPNSAINEKIYKNNNLIYNNFRNIGNPLSYFIPEGGNSIDLGSVSNGDNFKIVLNSTTSSCDRAGNEPCYSFFYYTLVSGSITNYNQSLSSICQLANTFSGTVSGIIAYTNLTAGSPNYAYTGSTSADYLCTPAISSGYYWVYPCYQSPSRSSGSIAYVLNNIIQYVIPVSSSCV